MEERFGEQFIPISCQLITKLLKNYSTILCQILGDILELIPQGLIFEIKFLLLVFINICTYLHIFIPKSIK